MIKIHGLDLVFQSKSKDTFQALSNITLSINEDTITLLKGVSGSGKSTLLSIIAGLLRPTQGSIEVFGESIAKMPDFHVSLFRKETIGIVFQNFNLLEELTLVENILSATVTNNQPVLSYEKRAHELLEVVGLSSKRDNLVKHLSGGEKQRCAIARALINKPKLLIADEPTANLDKNNSFKIIELFQKLHEDGVSLLIATHDSVFEDKLPKATIIHMEDGKII